MKEMDRYKILLNKRIRINSQRVQETIEPESFLTLPKFKPGDPLRSEDFNKIVGAVEELQYKMGVIYKALEIS